MKFLIVTITHNRGNRGHRMVYPPPYNAQEVDRNRRGPLVYEGGISHGYNDDTEEALLYLRDEIADRYARSPEMRIVSRARAETWMAAARSYQAMPDEMVMDVDRLHAITAKKAAGVAISAEDLDALDPASPVPGINRTKKTVADVFGA